MNSPAAQQSEPQGSPSSESDPQVVVRAGKYFICSACGTLVEIPPEYVGKLVRVAKSAEADEPRSKDSAEKHPPAVKTSPQNSAAVSSTTTAANAAGTSQDTPSRTSAGKALPGPCPPRRTSCSGEMIDGLRVPTAEEFDRALKWVKFHLTVLQRQGTYLKQLQEKRKQLRQQPQSQRPSFGYSPQKHIPPSNAPGMHSGKERGPPS